MKVTVTDTAKIARETWQLAFTGSFPYDSVKPGQFVMIRIGSGMEHVLRRPISITAVSEDCLTIVFRVAGKGTKWLSERKPDDGLDVLGPLGKGFPLPPANAGTLIVGGGIGAPPLYLLAERARHLTERLDIVLGFRTAADCFWAEEFAGLGNLALATDDGSLGTKGTVIDAIKALPAERPEPSPNLKQWDYVYACGPLPMLKAVKRHFDGRSVRGYVSLEQRMACGVGACYGCVCQSSDKSATKRVCADGPVFDWNEVAL